MSRLALVGQPLQTSGSARRPHLGRPGLGFPGLGFPADRLGCLDPAGHESVRRLGPCRGRGRDSADSLVVRLVVRPGWADFPDRRLDPECDLYLSMDAPLWPFAALQPT